jgi:hypothetical protein
MRNSTLGVSVALVWAGASLAGGCADKMVPAPGAAGGSGECSFDAPCALEAFDAGVAGPGVPSGPRPSFPATVTASVPPPPISGGTLLVTHDGTTAVAADPDRDAIYVVDVATMAVRYTISLKAGDEPGRLAEDGAGRVHVALRGGRALVTIDPETGVLLDRRSVCPAPRGVAWDGASDTVWVACATGELVQLPAGEGLATRSLHVERDLRDVIIQNGALSVTSFRSANILRVTSDGAITRRDSLDTGQSGVAPQVAWRAIASPSGSIVTVHQLESTDSVSTVTPGGYGGGGGGGGPLPPLSGGPIGLFPDAGEIFEGDAALGVSPLAPFFSSSIVRSALTEVTAQGGIGFQREISGVLPVDVAVGPDGTTIAGVTPGSAFTGGLGTFFVVTTAGTPVERDWSLGPTDQPIAVAFSASGNVILQTRDPAKLWMVPVAGGNVTSALLSAERREDTGHDVFHTQAGAQIACASCHPEGGDDGHVWKLDNEDRRTPSLRGTIAGTAPYHWPGDQKDLPTLVNNVYTLRMSGAQLPHDEMGALTGWIQTIPAPPAPSWVDPKAASAGRTVFDSSAAQCSSCHSGAKLTNNQTVDVGTGGKFQVPPLVGVGWRTPLLHGGCASTIADRFGMCSTKGHGDISKLSSQDIANLTAFLETL